MECSRCKYILTDEVANYSNRWFKKPLCRNCQDWIKNNDQIDIEYFDINNLPDYKKLIDSVKNNKQPDNLEFTYELIYDDGNIERCKSIIKIRNYGNFRFKEKTFQVINNESEIIICREIPSELFGPYVSHENDVQVLNYEEELIEIFKSRNILIKRRSLNEELFTKIILGILEPFFKIETEVWGTHFSGKKVKIDAILRPKNNSDWRNKDLVIGLEIKNPLLWETNNRRDTDVLAQCVDYSMSSFKDVNDMIVLVCPLPHKIKGDKLIRFISRYNVGHLGFNSKDGICFYYGGQPFWIEKREKGQAVGVLTKSLLRQKFGNRGGK